MQTADENILSHMQFRCSSVAIKHSLKMNDRIDRDLGYIYREG
jgi:hypothetical protein